MEPIDAALIDAREQENPVLADIARRHNVSRTTLSRRFRGVTNSKAHKHEKQQFLSPTQERALVQHINRLTDRGIPPTPAMVRTIAGSIAHQEPGIKWTTRFIKRWKDTISSHYLIPLDNSRQKADSYHSYVQYFDLIRQKHEKYGVLPENTYNMDEKGFSIGRLNKTRRVFTKSTHERKQLIGHSQDGSREWITVIACICGDGSDIPPCLIYKSLTGNVQDTWTQDLDPQAHNTLFGSSPTGWTNDHLGLEWLKVFDKNTKEKARYGRDKRLLYVDGHGSHINLKWLDYAEKHGILIAVYPPHSTHRLQPLDVSLFAPLGVFYSQEVDHFIMQSYGMISLKKRDFFRLFDNAYKKAFTERNIESAWRKTGLIPFDPNAVLSIFKDQEPSNNLRPSSSSSSNTLLTNYRAISKNANKAIGRTRLSNAHYVAKHLDTMHKLTTEISLLRSEVQGLRNTINHKQNHNKRSKNLFEVVRSEDNNAATFYSPHKIQHVKDLHAQKLQQKADQEHLKALQTESRHARRQLLQEHVAHKKAQRQQRLEASKAAAAARRRRKEAFRMAEPDQKHLNETTQYAVDKLKALIMPTYDHIDGQSKLLEAMEGKGHEIKVTRSGRTVRPPKHFGETHT